MPRRRDLKRTAWWLGGGAAAVALLGAIAWRAPASTAPAPAPVSTQPPTHAEPSLAALGTRAGFLFHVPPTPGQMLTYDVGWKDETHGNLAPKIGPPLVALTATVRLTALVPRDGESIIELAVDDVHPVGADGQPTDLAPALLQQTVGARADLVVHPDGALQSIRFGSDSGGGSGHESETQPGGRQFIQRLVGLLLTRPPDQPEKTSFGTATSEYTDREGGQVYRTRVKYTHVDGVPPGTDLASFAQELDSGALFTFGGDGVLVSVVDSESLRLVADDGTVALDASHGFSFHLRDSATGAPHEAPGTLASLEPHGPWETAVGAAAERKAIEDRLEGLTGPILLQHVRAVATLAGKAPDQVAFFNRATGLLKLHPEIAAQFVDLIDEPGMTYEGRAFALDILAGAGNDVVQDALVRALRDPRTQALPEYVQLYQRVALVGGPSDETVGFARQAFERLHAAPPRDQDEDDLRTAAIYTLGSVAGHLAATARRDAAEQLCKRLVDVMNGGKGAPRSDYITALGNAGLPSQEPLLLGLSADAEQDTRLAAINALRKYDTVPSRARVFGLLTSRLGPGHVDRETQAEALRAAELMTPTRQDVQQVAAAIVKDTLHRDLYGQVIPLFRKGVAPLSDVKPALDAMFARSAQSDSDLQTRIDTLRAELSARAP